MFILCVSPQLFGLTLSCLWSGLVALKMQRKPPQACCSPPCLVSPTLFDKYQSDKYVRNAAGKSAITAYSTPLSIVTNLSKGRMEKEPDPVTLTPILFFPIPIETFWLVCGLSILVLSVPQCSVMCLVSSGELASIHIRPRLVPLLYKL